MGGGGGDGGDTVGGPERETVRLGEIGRVRGSSGERRFGWGIFRWEMVRVRGGSGKRDRTVKGGRDGDVWEGDE